MRVISDNKVEIRLRIIKNIFVVRRMVISEGWPTFLIIGAGRSGTSSLYSYLNQHPDIYLSKIKEPKFFASRRQRTEGATNQDQAITEEEAYLKLFDEVSGEKHWGEASPTYLHDETSPQRISETIPDVKLIAILRNPIERAYSHYGLNVRLGRREEGKFGQWIQKAEPGDPFWEKYVVPGFYHAQLRRYYEHFNEEQLSVHLFTEFTEETRRVVAEIFDFLGVDPSFEPDLSTQRNASGVPRIRFLYRLMDGSGTSTAILKRILPTPVQRSLVKMRDRLLRDRGDMDAETRRRLREIYRDDILKLQELLGRELAHWYKK